jgi:magnesium chelatase subunit I
MESEPKTPLTAPGDPHIPAPADPLPVGVRSLRELMDLVSGKSFVADLPQDDYGIAEVLPFPFLAMVGQSEMKLALLLAVINPAIGGVLLIGPRGTGKTTAARSLAMLLPQLQRSACFYGCMPEDVEAGGLDAICPDCARKYAEGKSLTITDRVRMVELPLNSRLEDVIGYLDEHPSLHERVRLKRGILSQADCNILYADEINLLNDEIVDAFLDAASQGSYTVKCGALTATYKSRFTLIGSMNPEEGNLRPQIMDRFGLRVIVSGLTEPSERFAAYQRVVAYQSSPYQVLQQYNQDTSIALDEIQSARHLLPRVNLSNEIARVGIDLIQNLHIDSLRADITLFEAARAYAAADRRTEVTLVDLHTVAPMALRLRRSPFISDYLSQQDKEEEELNSLLKSNNLSKNNTGG